MAYEVRIKRKTAKNLTKLPAPVQKLFFLLVEDLKAEGPIQKSWPNFSALSENQYHCHLNYSYVSCWTWFKGSIEIEVLYVGSREKAPY
jgi:mRNA-degrading endonuclease RelE of RelBE toxin-antitoxin system